MSFVALVLGAVLSVATGATVVGFAFPSAAGSLIRKRGENKDLWTQNLTPIGIMSHIAHLGSLLHSKDPNIDLHEHIWLLLVNGNKARLSVCRRVILQPRKQTPKWDKIDDFIFFYSLLYDDSRDQTLHYVSTMC